MAPYLNSLTSVAYLCLYNSSVGVARVGVPLHVVTPSVVPPHRCSSPHHDSSFSLPLAASLVATIIVGVEVSFMSSFSLFVVGLLKLATCRVG